MEKKIAGAMEKERVTKLHHTKMLNKMRKNLWRYGLIETKTTSIDRAWWDVSDYVRFNDRYKRLHNEKDVFLYEFVFFAGNDVIRKRK